MLLGGLLNVKYLSYFFSILAAFPFIHFSCQLGSYFHLTAFSLLLVLFLPVFIVIKWVFFFFSELIKGTWMRCYLHKRGHHIRDYITEENTFSTFRSYRLLPQWRAETSTPTLSKHSCAEFCATASLCQRTEFYDSPPCLPALTFFLPFYFQWYFLSLGGVKKMWLVRFYGKSSFIFLYGVDLIKKIKFQFKELIIILFISQELGVLNTTEKSQ